VDPTDGVVIEIAGPAPATAVTTTPPDVVVLPFESIARAVREKFPAAVGRQVVEYVVPEVGTVSVLMIVVPARNCTCTIVAPTGATAVALTGTSDPTVTTVPGVGAVIDTPGGAAVTVTFTTEEETAKPFESVAVAERATGSAVDGVHAMENGAVVSVPIAVPFAKN
jgi:hypothetical protein